MWLPPALARGQQIGPQPVIHRVQSPNEQLNMVANSSRILTLDQRVPQAQVNNPEILDLTPLSPTQLQVYAKKAGVTQINLWTESKEIYTIEVLVEADARDLSARLASQFPNAALKVTPLPNAVLIKGYVDDQRDVSLIISIAQQYFAQVIDDIRVGGVQQVMLKVKLMEVSRTKLRQLGIDFTELSNSNGSFLASNPSGVLRPNGLLPTNQVITDPLTGAATGVSQVPGALATTGQQNFSFGLINTAQAFGAFLEALRQDDLAKILAEPVLVTTSGRPASFESGGQFPIQVPQSLGTISIQYKNYGTQVDFVPIVLGNGRIRLEVRPLVSELDSSVGITINGTTVPALTMRSADTGVEMRPGQTLAIAGLVQYREEAQRRGLPYISDLPYVGPLFSHVSSTMNEVELLIFVTPQLVEAMDPQEVPVCGPGLQTTAPTDAQLYFKGHIEVPKLCPPEMMPGDVLPPGADDNAPAAAPAPEPVVPGPTAPPAGASAPPPPMPQPRLESAAMPMTRPITRQSSAAPSAAASTSVSPQPTLTTQSPASVPVVRPQATSQPVETPLPTILPPPGGPQPATPAPQAPIDPQPTLAPPQAPGTDLQASASRGPLGITWPQAVVSTGPIGASPPATSSRTAQPAASSNRAQAVTLPPAGAVPSESRNIRQRDGAQGPLRMNFSSEPAATEAPATRGAPGYEPTRMASAPRYSSNPASPRYTAPSSQAAGPSSATVPVAPAAQPGAAFKRPALPGLYGSVGYDDLK
jgi:pilus assembly protein CpaC